MTKVREKNVEVAQTVGVRGVDLGCARVVLGGGRLQRHPRELRVASTGNPDAAIFDQPATQKLAAPGLAQTTKRDELKQPAEPRYPNDKNKHGASESAERAHDHTTDVRAREPKPS